MAIYKIQGKAEQLAGIYYEFDAADIPLGEGGMGKVYKGRCINIHTHSVRDVAVKFMYSDLPPYAIEKARREASIRFKHENLIEMLGFIETESKSTYGEIEHHYHVVSELLQGVTLDNLLEGKLVDQQGRLVPYAEKLYKDYKNDVAHFSLVIVKNILSGLQTMHDAGYIHRDIDPTNIMITVDGHIKLIDFGIAKKVHSLTTHDKHLTQAGQFIGKPEYAAPELVLGAINEQNQTTDLYAVGILLFQCLVGHVPFEGDRSDVLQKQLHKPLPLKLVKDRKLRAIIARATEKSRQKRYQSAAEFRVALDQRETSNPVVNPKKILIASLAAIGIVGSITLFYHFKRNDIEPNPVVTPSETSEKHPDNVTSLSYDAAVQALHEHNAQKSLNLLNELSNQGDAQASFLLSRLLFTSLKNDDYTPDSIRELKQTLDIQTDNIRAHDLLIKAIQQDKYLYQAYYELACDYWSASQRTPAVDTRNGELAEKYFTLTRKYASQHHDERYLSMTDYYLSRIKEWKENLRLIQNKL